MVCCFGALPCLHCRRGSSVQIGDSAQKPFSRTKAQTEFPQIPIRQIGKDIEVDIILGKHSVMGSETTLFQPFHQTCHRPLHSGGAIPDFNSRVGAQSKQNTHSC